MPIEVYTGKPGNGKTALMMERLTAEAGKGERPIFASGINGLAPGLATVLADPRRWNEIDPDGVPDCTCAAPGDATNTPRDPHAHFLPNGSLWFVDEAWKWFGHLHDAARQATPPHVLALAEHRHRGIDMVWTTQGPNQLYPFMRPLSADHYHCVRRFGTQVIEVFKWEELQDDVKSQAKRDAAVRQTRSLPKAVFGSYKSADAHTIKAKIPFRVYMLPLAILAAIALGYFALKSLRPSAMAGALTAEGPAAASAAAGQTGLIDTKRTGERTEPLSKLEYAELHLPRFGTMPQTAPVFDQRSVTVNPRLFCMSSRAGMTADGYAEASVTCLTEQGTRYELSEPEARTVARWGAPYNPYLEPERESRRDQVIAPEPQRPTPVLASTSASQVNGYGDIGVALNPGP